MLSWALSENSWRAYRDFPQRGLRRIPWGGKWQRHLSDLENPGPCRRRGPQGLEAAEGLEWSPSMFGICRPLLAVVCSQPSQVRLGQVTQRAPSYQAG